MPTGHLPPWDMAARAGHDDIVDVAVGEQPVEHQRLHESVDVGLDGEHGPDRGDDVGRAGATVPLVLEVGHHTEGLARVDLVQPKKLTIDPGRP